MLISAQACGAPVMLSHEPHTSSNQGARVNTQGGADQDLTAAERRARAEGEIGDAARRESNDELTRYGRGQTDPGTPGVGASAALVSGPISGMGGGYDLDPDELAAHIRRFERIAERIEGQRSKWRRALEHATPPSADSPATRQATRTRESIEIAMEAHTAKLERMNKFINKMKRAHGGYQVQEEEAQASFGGRGGRDEPASTGDLFKKDAGSSSANTGSLFERRAGQ